MSDPRAVLFTRRDLLSVTAAAAWAAMFPPGVYASGFHRFTHGAFDITVVSDGFITLPAEILLPDATPEERQMIMARLGGNDQGAPVQANIPLIRHGDDLILIDNGSGSNFQSTAGKLAVNLSALGVDPAKITKVVFTHAHPDHSGATTTSDGKVLYPNAHYFVSRVEWDFWTDKNFEAKMPQVLHGFAQGGPARPVRRTGPTDTRQTGRGDRAWHAGRWHPRPYARSHLNRTRRRREPPRHRGRLHQ